MNVCLPNPSMLRKMMKLESSSIIGYDKLKKTEENNDEDDGRLRR
jgi:hypothetical protein